MKITFYALADPKTGDVRYIGVTRKSLDERLKSHISDCHTRLQQPVSRWVKHLVEDRNQKPLIIQLKQEETETYEGIEKARREIVRHLKKRKYPILNSGV